MTALSEHLSGLVADFGLPALFTSVTLEAIGAPLPGESAILISAGAAAAGELDIRAVFLTAFAGAVLGDNIGYMIGRRLGRPAVARYGARFGATDANLEKVESVVRRHGAVMVIFARFFVVLRQLNGIVAGTSGMRWTKFLAANAVGAALWVGVWSTVAYRFGKSADILPFVLHHLALIAAVLIPALILALVLIRLRRTRA
jgi:membrane protein DedA with SNARE-associated domain